MPKSSSRTLDSLLRDVVADALRDELASLRGEVAALRKEIARGAIGRGLGSAGSRAKRAASGKRGSHRPPGTLTASQVKDIRSKLGVSQKRFAEMTGVTPVAVYFWESGRTTPSVDREKTLLRLVKSAPSSARAEAPKKAKRRKAS